jgi:hypothetical protein
VLTVCFVNNWLYKKDLFFPLSASETIFYTHTYDENVNLGLSGAFEREKRLQGISLVSCTIANETFMHYVQYQRTREREWTNAKKMWKRKSQIENGCTKKNSWNHIVAHATSVNEGWCHLKLFKRFFELWNSPKYA